MSVRQGAACSTLLTWRVAEERKLCGWQGWLGGAETPKPHPGTLPANHQSSNATYQPEDGA